MDFAKENGHSAVVKYFQHLKRKTAKANKQIKNSTVTQGNAEEYDIDSVLQSLGIEDETKKETSKKKPKKKTKKTKKRQVPQEPEDQAVSETEGAAGAEALVEEKVVEEEN